MIYLIYMPELMLSPLAVDAIIVYEHKLVFIRRKNEPYRDMLALPGGFVEADETTEQAVTQGGQGRDRHECRNS